MAVNWRILFVLHDWQGAEGAGSAPWLLLFTHSLQGKIFFFLLRSAFQKQVPDLIPGAYCMQQNVVFSFQIELNTTGMTSLAFQSPTSEKEKIQISKWIFFFLVDTQSCMMHCNWEVASSAAHLPIWEADWKHQQKNKRTYEDGVFQSSSEGQASAL